MSDIPRDRTPEWEAKEALVELQRFLSDDIAPLMFAESMEVLLRVAPPVAAAQAEAWAREQYSISGGQAPISDYLYHSVKKIHLLLEYRLLPSDRLAPWLSQFAAQIVALCPPTDRALLTDNIRRIGKAAAVVTSAIPVLHRQTGTERIVASGLGPARSGAAAAGDAASGDGLRRLTILLNRLAPAAAAAPGTETDRRPAAPGNAFSEIVELAARDSADGAQLDRNLARLKELGIGKGMDEVFRLLGSALPGWAIPLNAGESVSAPLPTVGSVEALRNMVTLAPDADEGARRFHEMVRAAIEQFNEGSPGRAVTMLQLAERIVAEKKVDAARVELTRRTLSESVDLERMRGEAEDEAKHPQLRQILSFFPAFSIESVLRELELEGKRERRRLLVTMLLVYGAATRSAIHRHLQDPVHPGAGEAGWYFQRNLMNVLRRIPRPEGAELDAEIEVIGSLARPGQHALIVKDAIAALGQIHDPKAELALLATVKEFEALLLSSFPHRYSVEDLHTILDRAYSGLARTGSREAVAAVVEHGLSGNEAFGDTIARLAELSTTNLEAEPATAGRLAATLRRELPRKVFGFVIARKAQNIEALVRALSGTPSPEVRRLFTEITDSYPDQAFAKPAAEALKQFAAPAPAAAPKTASPSLTGDLELFGLPTLLQNLAQSEVSGTLSVTGRTGEILTALAFDRGRLQDCRTGMLRGKDAVYQLFERPIPGSFVFVSRDAGESTAEPSNLMEIVPLIFEGSRRYDEFRQALALVPEGVRLARGSAPPTAPEDESDTTLVQGVWSRIGAGKSPEECESELFVDSFRVYRLLSHWVDQGSLKIVDNQSATA